MVAPATYKLLKNLLRDCEQQVQHALPFDKHKEKTEMNFETYWQRITDGIDKRGLYTLDVVKDLVKEAFEIGRDYRGEAVDKEALDSTVFLRRHLKEATADLSKAADEVREAKGYAKEQERIRMVAEKEVSFLRQQLQSIIDELLSARSTITKLHVENLNLKKVINDQNEAATSRDVANSALQRQLNDTVDELGKARNRSFEAHMEKIRLKEVIDDMLKAVQKERDIAWYHARTTVENGPRLLSVEVLVALEKQLREIASR